MSRFLCLSDLHCLGRPLRIFRSLREDRQYEQHTRTYPALSAGMVHGSRHGLERVHEKKAWTRNLIQKRCLIRLWQVRSMAMIDHWHPVLKSNELGKKPVGIKFAGHAIVLYRPPPRPFSALPG